MFKGSQNAWNKFLVPDGIVAAPFIGMAAGAKTRNPKVAQATTNFRKSISGVKFLSLTVLHSNRLILKVM